MFSLFRRIYLKWRERQLKLPIRSDVPLERPGTGYGGWLIPANRFNKSSVVYLVGAGEDVSFDVAVANQYGCAVEIIDPTPRAIDHVAKLIECIKNGEKMSLSNTETGYYPDYKPEIASLLHLHPIGLWDSTTVLKFFTPANEEHVSHSIVNLQKSERSIEVPVCKLSELMQKNGHTHIDLLKIDIEGAEYKVIETIIEDKLSIDVICIEFDETSRNHLDTGYVERIKDSINSLMAFGYEIIAKEPDCNNFTLMHERLL